MEKNYLSSLDTDLIDSKTDENVVITPFMEHEWVGLSSVKDNKMLDDYDTRISEKDLDQIVKSVYDLDNFDLFIKKVSKLMQERNKMYNNDRIDWGIAENLAYGSLLNFILYSNANLEACTTASTSSELTCRTGHKLTFPTSVQ